MILAPFSSQSKIYTWPGIGEATNKVLLYPQTSLLPLTSCGASQPGTRQVENSGKCSFTSAKRPHYKSIRATSGNYSKCETCKLQIHYGNVWSVHILLIPFDRLRLYPLVHEEWDQDGVVIHFLCISRPKEKQDFMRGETDNISWNKIWGSIGCFTSKQKKAEPTSLFYRFQPHMSAWRIQPCGFPDCQVKYIFVFWNSPVLQERIKKWGSY